MDAYQAPFILQHADMDRNELFNTCNSGKYPRYPCKTIRVPIRLKTDVGIGNIQETWRLGSQAEILICFENSLFSQETYYNIKCFQTAITS